MVGVVEHIAIVVEDLVGYLPSLVGSWLEASKMKKKKIKESVYLRGAQCSNNFKA